MVYNMIELERRRSAFNNLDLVNIYSDYEVEILVLSEDEYSRLWQFNANNLSKKGFNSDEIDQKLVHMTIARLYFSIEWPAISKILEGAASVFLTEEEFQKLQAN